MINFKVLLLPYLTYLSLFAIEKIEPKYLSNKNIALSIELDNGVILEKAYITGESTGKVFSNNTFTNEDKPSILVPRSYGIVNVPLVFIKKITVNNSKPYVKSPHKFKWEMNLLEMIDSAEVSQSGETITDDSLEHISELSPILAELYLFSTNITDKSVDKLSTLENLTHLVLNKSINEEAKNKLKKALKKTKIR